MLRDSGRVVDLQFVQHSVESVEFLHRVAEKHGVADAVRTGPALPRPEFLSACRGASILLLAVGHDSRGQQHAGAIPGKLYDYMAAGRPILVVGPRDCEAGRLVREHDLGMSVADDDAAGIAGAIESLLGLCPSEGGNGSRRSKVELFEANHVVRSFANLFNELCCGGPGGSMPESTLAHISPIEDAHRERAPHARMSEQG